MTIQHSRPEPKLSPHVPDFRTKRKWSCPLSIHNSTGCCPNPILTTTGSLVEIQPNKINMLKIGHSDNEMLQTQESLSGNRPWTIDNCRGGQWILLGTNPKLFRLNNNECPQWSTSPTSLATNVSRATALSLNYFSIWHTYPISLFYPDPKTNPYQYQSMNMSWYFDP